jgi:hypothetical protein
MRPRLRIVAALVSLAFAGAARADWVCPVPGNALNPNGVNPATAGRWMDEEGMGTRIPAARNPSGQLYNIPYDAPDETPGKSEKGWVTGGFVEGGGLHIFGDPKNATFLQYKDLKSGMYLNNFGFWGEKPSEARYYEVTGGAVGMDDQFYQARFGRYNDWKITAYYDGTPQVYTETYRSLWSGLGSSNLTLNPGMKPGGATSAGYTQTQIQNALANTPPGELEVVRKRLGARFDMNISEAWKVYASITDQKREGAQPFGAVFGGGGGGGNMELAQSIDYSTYDFNAGLRYTDTKSAFNVSASASFFRNNIDSMTFQNPVYITTSGTNGLTPASFTTGRFSTAPDNEAFNLKAEYARHFPELYRGYFTSVVSVGTMRQNANLLPPSEFDLAGGTLNPGNVSLANNWNTTAALQRPTAEARIDTVLGDFGMLLRPTSALDVRGKLRYYQTDNHMDYTACNPLTGQFGRLLNDGSGTSIVSVNTLTGANPAGTSPNAYNTAACNLAAARALNLAPVAGNIPLGSIPYDYKQVVGNLSADYRVGRASSVSAALERETFHRDFRERDETWEDKIKLGYVDRGTLEGTIRLSYEYDNRGGGAYNTNPYAPYYSMSLGPVPAVNTQNMASWFHSIDQFRSFDLADRRQNVLNGRVDYAVSQDMDAAFTLQLKDADYPSDLGRVGHANTNTATIDLSYRAGSNAVLYGYYSFQQASMEQKGVQPNSCTVGSTYYFYSNGAVANANIGATPPATPAGATLVGTQNVLASNWMTLCAGEAAMSPLFPDSRGWDVASHDRNQTFGFGLKYDFGKVKLESDFTRALARTRIGYSYNAAGLGLSNIQQSLAGSGLADLVFAQSMFNASLLMPITPNTLMRFIVRYESGRIRDWHYDGVAVNPMPANNGVYLDAGPVDYRTTTVGILFHVRL